MRLGVIEEVIKRIRLDLAIGSLFIAGASFVIAQGNATPHASYQYSSANEQTVTGVVEAVKEYPCPVSSTVGTHLTVKLATGSIEVHLAPAKFVKDYEVVIYKGDQVEIRGARIMFEGRPALIAKIVAVDRTTYAFRFNDGKPLW